MYGTGTPENEESNEVLFSIASETEKKKEEMSEELFGEWIIGLHNHMRENMGLPNKIFTIARDKENNKAQFIFFDKEPDGKHYEVFTEEREDGFTCYIEVED
jgi:hypothetical protein